MNDKKTNKTSIRFTEKEREIIESYCGCNFNAKLSNLLRDINSLDTLQQDVRQLQYTREQLCRDIARLQDQKDLITDMFKAFEKLQKEYTGELNELTRFKKEQIRMQITKAGFTATEESIDKIYSLDRLTGERNSMKDILVGYKKRSYVDSYGIRAQKLVDELYQEFHNQDLAKMQHAMQPDPVA